MNKSVSFLVGIVAMVVTSVAVANDDVCSRAELYYKNAQILTRCQQGAQGNVSGRAEVTIQNAELCVLQTLGRIVLFGHQSARVNHHENATITSLVNDIFETQQQGPGSRDPLSLTKTSSAQSVSMNLAAGHSILHVRRILIKGTWHGQRKTLWEDAQYRCVPEEN